MNYEILGKNKDIAMLISDEVLIKDTQTALDLIATLQYETDCDQMIINKSCIAEEFFVLSNGIAGEIIQKFVNYHKRVAIIGDYSNYSSKALNDFFYESNKGNSLYFVSSCDEALEKLEG